jgi:hypothetical protein
MHSGVLFVDPRPKDTVRRQFCRIGNAVEAMGLPDPEYVRRAVVIEIPQDVSIRGVFVVLLFCDSAGAFRASNRNGIRSRDAMPDGGGVRIASFQILSRFDEIPKCQAPFAIVRGSVPVPEFCFSFTGELAIRYTREFAMQLLSLGNILDGLFSVYQVFFDVEGDRYIIELEDNESELGFELSVVQLVQPLMIEMLMGRLSAAAETRDAAEAVPYWEMSIGEDSLRFGDKEFGPVSAISLLNV